MKLWIILIMFLFASSIFAQNNTKEKIIFGLENAKVTENGKTVIDLKSKCGYGEVVGFHLPQRGWFIASLNPLAGFDFQKIGKLRNNKISFKFDNRKYEIISDQPISEQIKQIDLWITKITPLANKKQSDDLSISCSSNFSSWLKNNLPES